MSQLRDRRCSVPREQRSHSAAISIATLAPRLRPTTHVAAEAEDDLLAFYAFPADHRPKLRSTNPLERVNR